MSVIINQEQCTRCGTCMRVCVSRVFSQGDDGMITADDEKCFHCGHCFAACPARAITLDGHAPDSLPCTENTLFSEEQRDMLFRSRRSIRAYRQEPLQKAHLHRALELANYAPTARNAREVHWTVLNGREKVLPLVKEVALVLAEDPCYGSMLKAVEKGHDPVLRTAPCLIMAHTEPWVWGEVDCAAAVSYLELALHSMGIGSCWCGFVIGAGKQAALPHLPLPKGHVAYAGLMVGYPDVSYASLPPRAEPHIHML